MIAKLLTKLWAKPCKPTVEPIRPHSWQNQSRQHQLTVAKEYLGNDWVLHPKYSHRVAHALHYGTVLQDVKSAATLKGRI